MRRVNLAKADVRYQDDDPPGFRSGMYRMGPDLGAEITGTSLYELPPGEALCPYHYEHGEEEWLLVLEGEPSVRTPDGTERLEQWDLLCFPRGPAGAHQVRNDGETTARLLMWSNVVYPTVSVYPDSDKIGVWTAGKRDDVIVKRDSGVDYWLDEG